MQTGPRAEESGGGWWLSWLLHRMVALLARGAHLLGNAWGEQGGGMS